MCGAFSVDVRVTTQNDVTVGIVRLGTILVEITDVTAAQHVCTIWRQARVQAELIGEAISSEWIARQGTGVAASSQVRLFGAPVVTSTFMAKRPHHRAPVPAHVRFTVGPLVWEIYDRAAWVQFGQSWQTVVDRMS